MPSPFKLNQLSLPLDLSFPEEVQKPVVDARDKEIYALRQQLQMLKMMYKKLQNASLSNVLKVAPENEYTKQRIEKLSEALAEKERETRILKMSAKEEIQKEKLVKQKALNEVTALHGQMGILKQRLKNLENKHSKIKMFLLDSMD